MSHPTAYRVANRSYSSTTNDNNNIAKVLRGFWRRTVDRSRQKLPAVESAVAQLKLPLSGHDFGIGFKKWVGYLGARAGMRLDQLAAKCATGIAITRSGYSKKTTD